MSPLDLVRLSPLMQGGSGIRDITVAVIDGPVALSHPDLREAITREVPGKIRTECTNTDSQACRHGTLVAGILCARRGSAAQAICPGCTLLIRPIFGETVGAADGYMPQAAPEELAEAIAKCVDAGAWIINLSAALGRPSPHDRVRLKEALDYAARRAVIIVAAAGNQGTVGSSAITRHPWVIPVVACDIRGWPLSQSNVGSSIGRQGLSAPGENITSLGSDEKPQTFGGTSAAAPFVTGAMALLWSEFPDANAACVKLAIAGGRRRRNVLVPAILDAEAAYREMADDRNRRKSA